MGFTPPPFVVFNRVIQRRVMDFKIFPATLMPDGDRIQKVPLERGWQTKATKDPETIALWQSLHRDRIKMWGVPCGKDNNILVLDIDVKDAAKNGLTTLHKEGLIVPPTMSQRTPSGGYHFIFKYPNGGCTYGNRVGFLPGLDIRGEGGWIAHYGIDSTPIAEAPDWLVKHALNRTAPIDLDKLVRVSPEIAEATINDALENIREAPEGESNNVLNIESFRIGQLVASGSVTREYAQAALYRAAKERGKPDYEAHATIKSGLDGGGKKPLTSPFSNTEPIPAFPIPPPPQPESRWTPVKFSTEDLTNTSNLRKPQLFKDWSTEDIHITTADGGTGKTTLKLFEAICLALGERFLGFDCVQPGKTLFITGEDTQKKLGAMIGAICRQMGLFQPHPGNDEKLKIIKESVLVKKDADLCLIAKDRQNFLHPNGDALRKVLEAIDDIQPKMIVFDPISSFWGSESALNDMNKAVTKFMSVLVERSNACVEMINHMGKSSSANKDMSQFAGRGGSGLPSNARVSRVLRPIDEEEYLELTGVGLNSDQTAMMCNVNKFSDGSPLYNKPFLIIRQGYLFSRKILSDVKIREEEKKLSDVARVFAFIKEQREMDRYPTIPVIKAHFMNHIDNLSEARSERAVKMLCYNGYMGEMCKHIENPDPEIRDRAVIIEPVKVNL